MHFHSYIILIGAVYNYKQLFTNVIMIVEWPRKDLEKNGQLYESAATSAFRKANGNRSFSSSWAIKIWIYL